MFSKRRDGTDLSRCEAQDIDGVVKPAETDAHVRGRDSRGPNELSARVFSPHGAMMASQQAVRHEISSRALWVNHCEWWFRQKRTHQTRAQQYREQRDETKGQNPHVEKFSRWLNGQGADSP